MKPKKKVAIFDIDGTIFRSSLLIEVTEALIAEGIFPKEVKNMYAKEYRAWANRQDSYEKYIGGVVKAFEKHIKGINHNDFLRLTRQMLAVNKNRVYRYTRDLVKELKKQKYYLLAISHSPKELVDEFATSLGFDKVYGRVYKFNQNNEFTGGTLYLDLISNKANIVNRAVAKEGLTLKDSVGVGDSEGDVPFLKLVDCPICFNPNSALYSHAKKAKWEVVVERKDVIYHIQ